MQIFYDREDIDQRLLKACQDMADVIAKQYDPSKPSIDAGNLIAHSTMVARDTMLLAFFDIAGDTGRGLLKIRIDEMAHNGAQP